MAGLGFSRCFGARPVSAPIFAFSALLFAGSLVYSCVYRLRMRVGVMIVLICLSVFAMSLCAWMLMLFLAACSGFARMFRLVCVPAVWPCQVCFVAAPFALSVVRAPAVALRFILRLLCFPRDASSFRRSDRCSYSLIGWVVAVFAPGSSSWWARVCPFIYRWLVVVPKG